MRGKKVDAIDLVYYTVFTKGKERHVEVRCPEVSMQDDLNAIQRESVSSVRVRGQRRLFFFGLQSLSTLIWAGAWGTRQEVCSCNFLWDVTFVFVGSGSHLPQ